ncbi:hypothetical protein PsorP6_004446 [Peronosclerospora sorghi]|uniref:Uncharacterized protein n=1 Tax=Peronosclerospora sorghi TaxID=230839 RepID=A0ACC0VQQ4_9STRA|nr:hypothetical protein PsorP6_004446 [Peronosclerospora sorghi]
MQHHQAHNGSVTCVTFHQSGNYLLSTSHDHSCTLWEIREGQVLYTLQGHHGAVNVAAFFYDGQVIASGGVDSCILIWNAAFDYNDAIKSRIPTSTYKPASQLKQETLRQELMIQRTYPSPYRLQQLGSHPSQLDKRIRCTRMRHKRMKAHEIRRWTRRFKLLSVNWRQSHGRYRDLMSVSFGMKIVFVTWLKC